MSKAAIIADELSEPCRARLLHLAQAGSAEAQPIQDEILALCDLVSIIQAGDKAFTGGMTALGREVVTCLQKETGKP